MTGYKVNRLEQKMEENVLYFAIFSQVTDYADFEEMGLAANEPQPVSQLFAF